VVVPTPGSPISPITPASGVNLGRLTDDLLLGFTTMIHGAVLIFWCPLHAVAEMVKAGKGSRAPKGVVSLEAPPTPLAGLREAAGGMESEDSDEFMMDPLGEGEDRKPGGLLVASELRWIGGPWW
jgi:hypothetical protein